MRSSNTNSSKKNLQKQRQPLPTSKKEKIFKCNNKETRFSRRIKAILTVAIENQKSLKIVKPIEQGQIMGCES